MMKKIFISLTIAGASLLLSAVITGRGSQQRAGGCGLLEDERTG